MTAMSRVAQRLRVLSVLAVFFVLAPPAAAKTTKMQCADAYEKSQELRSEGKLLAAREQLLTCAQQQCPSFVRSDCAQWLTEVERETPTIVVAAKGADGKDAVDVRVIVDDQLLLESLDGKAVPLDPGIHRFRFERPGSDAVQRQILIRQGEKNRVVEVEFAPDEPEPLLEESEPSSRAGAVVTDPGQRAAPEPSEPGQLRPYAYAAGGVGAAGLSAWAVLGLVGKAEERELERTCKPNCSAGEVDAVERKYLIADVFLGVGLAGVGAGIALFILSMPSQTEPSADATGGVHLDVAPLTGGAAATVRGRF